MNTFRVLLGFPFHVCIFPYIFFTLGGRQLGGNIKTEVDSVPKQDFPDPENGKPQSIITTALGFISPDNGTFLCCHQVVHMTHHYSTLFEKLWKSKLHPPTSGRALTIKLVPILLEYSRVPTLWGTSITR